MMRKRETAAPDGLDAWPLEPKRWGWKRRGKPPLKTVGRSSLTGWQGDRSTSRSNLFKNPQATVTTFRFVLVVWRGCSILGGAAVVADTTAVLCSRSDQISTAGTEGAAGVGVVVVDGVGRGRGACGGVVTRLEDGRGTPQGPNAYVAAD